MPWISYLDVIEVKRADEQSEWKERGVKYFIRRCIKAFHRQKELEFLKSGLPSSKNEQTRGRQTHFQSVERPATSMRKQPKHECVHQYQMTKPYYNCPRCYYWNERAQVHTQAKSKERKDIRDPDRILEDRARMHKLREERSLKRTKKLKEARFKENEDQSPTLPTQNRQEMISAYNEAGRKTRELSATPKRSPSEIKTPQKLEDPESRIQRSSSQLEFNPSPSLKPPSRLVLGKYPNAIKTKYMEDYPSHKDMPHFEKLVRKSFLYHPFSHPLETKTTKHIEFQGKQVLEENKAQRHEENLKVERDCPFVGGTMYSKGFLNWGSGGGYVTEKPQYYPMNMPLNTKTSYGQAFRAPDNADMLKPKVTMDRNASSKLFPTRKFDGETTKNRDFRTYANVEKTTSWKPQEVSKTGLKGIFDTTNKSTYRNYLMKGKGEVQKDLLKAPIF